MKAVIINLRVVVFGLLCLSAVTSRAAEWQWSVPLQCISKETGRQPEAFLWIPPTCQRVRAVVMGKHNMCEEPLFEHPVFRRAMGELDFAIVWITPGIDSNWDVRKGTQQVFEQMMDSLAAVSGYAELAHAPVVPVGHSAMATFPWNFAAWDAGRTLAVISLHGDAPRTNMTGYGGANLEWGRNRNIDGIPGLMIEGEFEWAEDRVRPALAFRTMYPESTVSFLGDVGHGHFDVSDKLVDYICLFLKKAAEYRLTTGEDTALKKLNPRDGWLAERWRPQGGKREKPAPYNRYKGDRHDAFWYFDEETAVATERYYAGEQGKKEQYIGFMQEGRMLPFHPHLHARIQADFRPESDGLTFHLNAVYTDTMRTARSSAHASTPIRVDRICGPVSKVNDSTFTVSFYRMGMDNPRRTNDIWLIASNDGDRRYKSSVQQLNLRIPYRHTEGKRQAILFPSLPDVTAGTEQLELRATSDCGLPIHYYIKEGPAEIDGNRIRFTAIPPRASYPIKVTVVAWQYGIAGKVQTAEPVERTFYIKR